MLGRPTNYFFSWQLSKQPTDCTNEQRENWQPVCFYSAHKGDRREEYLMRTYKSFLVDLNTTSRDLAFSREIRINGYGVERWVRPLWVHRDHSEELRKTVWVHSMIYICTALSSLWMTACLPTLGHPEVTLTLKSKNCLTNQPCLMCSTLRSFFLYLLTYVFIFSASWRSSNTVICLNNWTSHNIR